MSDRPRYHNGILVYTAQDIHDDVADGMDPDCLFVGLEKYDALTAELARAIRALEDERDELRGKLDDVRMGIGCARGQRTTQYCADLTQRDEVIRRLLTQAQIYARALEIDGRTE